MQDHEPHSPLRRRLLAAAGLTLGAGFLAAPCRAGGVVAVHGGPVVPPVAVPPLRLTLADGRRTTLSALLTGRASALQLIFTGCTTTCPMQGAIFQRVQRGFTAEDAARFQLISLSINPLDDTPTALRTWLARFGAKPGWLAGSPEPDDLAVLTEFFAGGASSLDGHATEVQIVDREGALVWRTNELPAPESVARQLRQA
jgi:protein SCO1/2